MFNLLEARYLFYREKSLDDYDIESEGSIFKSFFETLLRLDGTRIANPDVEVIITDMFNDACYICTIALHVRRPALKIGKFRQYCVADKSRQYSFATDDTRADEVLCMVYYLLKNCQTQNAEKPQFISVLDKHLREHSNHSLETYKCFSEKCNNHTYSVSMDEFNQHVLSIDEFEWTGQEPDWKDITNQYNKKDIKEVIEFWEDPQQRDIVIDDIVSEVSSDYYYDGPDGQRIRFGESQEEMIDYVESLRLTDRSLKKIIEESKRERDEKYAKTNRLNDPQIYPYQIPFLRYDENNETIISRTAKGINEGKLNPYKVNWMEVTLYFLNFVTDLLEKINPEFLMDVAQAIDDEEARHVREDGQYTCVHSNYYGTGRGSDSFYSCTRDNLNDEEKDILASHIAEGILKNRNNADKFQKKMETRQEKKTDGTPGVESHHDHSANAVIPKELAESEDWKKLKAAGVINENGQSELSRTEKAILAEVLLERMGKDHQWIFFEKIWNCKNLRVDFQDALNLQKYHEFKKRIIKTLR